MYVIWNSCICYVKECNVIIISINLNVKILMIVLEVFCC